MRTRASTENGLLVTPQATEAAVILLNPGAMDQGILTVGRFDSGYRAGIVAYQQLKTVPFKTLQGGMQMLMIRVMMILAVVCTVVIFEFAFWGDRP